MDKQSEFLDILSRIRATFILREFLIIGFIAAIVFSYYSGTLFYSVNVSAVIYILLIWLATGFLFRFLVNRQKKASRVGNLYLGYLTLVEIPLLTAVIYHIGAVEWMGPIFFLFPIVFSGIIFPRGRALLVCAVASLSYILMVFLTHFGVIPFEYTFIAQFSPLDARNYLIDSVFFVVGVFFGIGMSANLFRELLTRKTAELEETKEKLEEEREFLGVRVRARTKELEELAKSLEYRVEERTKEIKEKMDELEKFHSLAVGRELKMVELKQKLKEAEEELKKTMEE